MARQVINVNNPDDLINVGLNANDNRGDPLRSAFIKLNDALDKIDANFAELYSESEVHNYLGNFVFDSNTVTVDNNGELIVVGKNSTTISLTIDDITSSNPCEVFASPGTGSLWNVVSEGYRVKFSGITTMTELNGNSYYIKQSTANSFLLYTDAALTQSVDSTGFSSYVSTNSETATNEAITGGTEFRASILTYPSIINVQVGWTVSGAGLTGTRTITAVLNQGGIYYIEIATGGGGFNPATSYTFLGSSIDGGGTITTSSGVGNTKISGGAVPSAGAGIQGDLSLTGENVYVESNYNTWSFGSDGNLTLPVGGIIKNNDGTQYGGATGGASVTESDTPPVDPSAGDLWYDTSGGRMYVYFDNTWVDANPVPDLNSVGNYVFSADIINNDTGIFFETLRGTITLGADIEAPGDSTHFHIAFQNSNAIAPSAHLYLGDDFNYFKVDSGRNGVHIGASNGTDLHSWHFNQDGNLYISENSNILRWNSNISNYEDVANLDLHLAANGLPVYESTSTAGYSFKSDTGYDTGMFSSQDGHLELYTNARPAFTATDNDVSIIVSWASYTGQHEWHFDRYGVLTLPLNGDIKDSTGSSVFKTNLSQFTNDLEIDASSLTGDTLASGITGSSLTSVGILSGLTSSGIVHITNTQDSTNADTGALQVDGGAHITKNLIAEGTVYAGIDAYSEALTNPLIVASSPSGVAGGYSQVAILNNTAEASGDFQVMIDGYDVNVSDTGWADLGMAGSNFSDARYTITQPGDGYVFVSGKESSTNGGSLVLATDGSGVTNDIVFATGGFLTANEKMRLLDSDGSLDIASGKITSDNDIHLTSNGNIFRVGAGGAVDIPGPVTWTNTSDPWQAIMNWNDIDKFFIVSSPSDFKIRVNDGQYSAPMWTFGTDGVITLPPSGDIKDSLGNSVFSSTYTLPTATTSVLGGVKVDGSTIIIVDGVISATGAGGGGYSLPIASISTLGGVKIDGSTININGSGVISAVIPTNVSTFTNDAGYLTSVTTITGNAGTATKLFTARNINGVAFDGTGDITVTAAASTLTGTTLNAGVTQSSLTSVGTLTNLTVTNTIVGSVSGSAGSVAGTNITGTTLASNVVSSSLTSVGTLANLTVTNPIAGTVQNGVVTTGTYADPTWITSLAGSKVTNAVLTTDTGTVTNTMLANSSITINGTSVSLGGSTTVTASADASALTGTTLASGVTASSLTSVGTLTSLTTSGTLTRSGNISSAAWTTAGIGLKLPAATYTDTSSSGAVTYNYVNAIGIPTLASTSATTVSTSATLHIAGDPIAGSNTTVTSSSAYSLYVGGKSFFVNTVRLNGGITSGGGAAMMSFSNSGVTVQQPTASTSYTTGSLIVSGGVGIAGNVYTNGYIAQAACPAFRVYGSGSSTITVGTVLTSTNFTLDYQQGGTNLVVATGIFTAPVAGLYQINLSGRAYSNAGIASQLAVVKNPSTTALVMCMIEWAANTTVNHMGASTVAKLAAGDTLVAKVLLGSAQFDANDSWSVAFLG